MTVAFAHHELWFGPLVGRKATFAGFAVAAAANRLT
jgi:hypothetical protein